MKANEKFKVISCKIKLTVESVKLYLGRTGTSLTDNDYIKLQTFFFIEPELLLSRSLVMRH